MRSDTVGPLRSLFEASGEAVVPASVAEAPTLWPCQTVPTMASEPVSIMAAIHNRLALAVAGDAPASVSATAVRMMTSTVGSHGDISGAYLSIGRHRDIWLRQLSVPISSLVADRKSTRL